MPTTNLGVTYITQSQAGKEITANAAFDVLDAAIAGVASKSVAGGTDVTLSAAEARNAVLTLTGLLTGNINVIVPSTNKVYTIFNNTTGAFTLTVKTAAGTGIAVTQAAYAILYCNATNVLQASVGGGAGGAALSGITAAAGANTIDNTDFAQVWQWKITTAAKVALQISEPTASTGASSPVLVQIDTLASSTAVPLLVKSATVEVFRVGAGITQIRAAAGSSGTPIYGFQSDTNTGMYSGGADILNFAVGGAIMASLTTTQLMVPIQNTTAAPGLAAYGLAGLGINMNTGTFQICVTSFEHTMFATTAGLSSITSSNANASATGYSRVFKKARGSPAFPTAITSGDDILDLKVQAYVGGAGYITPAQMKFTTEGTLADSATGIGGVIKFLTMAVGSAIAERMRIDSKGNTVLGTAAGTTTDTDNFLYVVNCPGAQTGVPTTYAGRSAMRYDTTNKKLWMYNSVNAAWDFVQFT